MAIHLKPTEDTHDENSSEVAVHKQVPDDSTSAMSVNKHRVALIAGVCGLVVLAGVVTTIGVMVSKSFSSSPSETNDFDFPDTGPDFSGVTKTPNVTNTTAPTLPLLIDLRLNPQQRLQEHQRFPRSLRLPPSSLPTSPPMVQLLAHQRFLRLLRASALDLLSRRAVHLPVTPQYQHLNQR